MFIPSDLNAVPTDIPFSSGVLLQSINTLRRRYNFLSFGSLGKSVLGTDIYTVRVGAGARKVFMNASHHGNEWITTPLLMKLLEEYSQAIETGGSMYGRSAAELFENSTLFMVPMVNPDGVDIVTEFYGPSSAPYRMAQQLARNYPQIEFPAGWKANIEGTDPNLQYPAGWYEARRIKFAEGFTRPGPRDYVGPGPLTAPESFAVYDYTLAYDFDITLSYHTQGGVIFWKFLDIEPPGAFELGQIFADVSGYTLEDVPYASGFAGYKDWFIQDFNRPGFTIEAGYGENPLPLAQFWDIYSQNIGIFVNALAS
ncbi:MAG: M14 family metallopeptidase [Oscillospiraceae bacterium]|jgi:g-D-glutamyl-meso-diaminopimelate peptidase